MAVNTRTRSKKKVNKPRTKVADVIVSRIIKSIEEDKRLPWQKPFLEVCYNWLTEKDYTGINRIMLRGEYIGFNQLMDFNKKYNTTYAVPSGCGEIVLLYVPKQVSEDDEKSILSGGIPQHLLFKKLFQKDDGHYYYRVPIYKYVFNIKHIADENGNVLPTKFTKKVIDFVPNEKADKIISNYCKRTGVQIYENNGGRVYYSETDDSIHSVPKDKYKASEAYYRVMFHEIGHSTGIGSRLDRKSYAIYSKDRKTHSREEMVAEFTSLLLATECGFSDDYWTDNSDYYIQGWVSYLRDKPNAIIRAMADAEKAVEYILNGG
jgi:antirestriction protein ArdC